MMCICGNTLPPNAKECPACGGSFKFNSTPILRTGRLSTQEAKPRFNPVVVMSIIAFVATVFIGVVVQTLL